MESEFLSVTARKADTPANNQANHLTGAYIETPITLGQRILAGLGDWTGRAQGWKALDYVLYGNCSETPCFALRECRTERAKVVRQEIRGGYVYS
jgi:hypothetical protein